MIVPSRMSLRGVPSALHLKVRMAHAVAWEALIDTHTAQAFQFLNDFSSRVTALDGLDLFFRVVPVPEQMQEAVRTRTLLSLDPEGLLPLTELPLIKGWQWLNISRVLENARYRRAYNEKTLQLARMVGARATEAAITTHVDNALKLARLLDGIFSFEDAIQQYLGEFGLAAGTSQAVLQRTHAQAAGLQLAAQNRERQRVSRDPELAVDLPLVEDEPEAAHRR